ncbi:hypothetical protein Poly24_11740 [Rosistilla carotiformis]|uniref:Uncharacterized protein n=1 Tax=Rosistilla carotiformis TaxID=2528017 RepID=A0A518JPL2_9BACT|nr:hypothetical protein Poly24_11740 [Rosistilla carotiformis]
MLPTFWQQGFFIVNTRSWNEPIALSGRFALLHEFGRFRLKRLVKPSIFNNHVKTSSQFLALPNLATADDQIVGTDRISPVITTTDTGESRIYQGLSLMAEVRLYLCPSEHPPSGCQLHEAAPNYPYKVSSQTRLRRGKRSFHVLGSLDMP